MNAVSVDRQRSWKTIGTERQTGLEIVLLKRTYVFPWSQFLYAEGGDDEIRAVFTTHDVIVRGTALTGNARRTCGPADCPAAGTGTHRSLRGIVGAGCPTAHSRTGSGGA